MSITKKLAEIFQNRFGITLDENAFAKDLAIGITGIGLRSYEMLYLLKDIEEAFAIEIEPEPIETGKIRSLKGLLGTIEAKLEYEENLPLCNLN